MGAQRDQSLAQRDDARVARGRAGFDHQQRIAGLLPHQLGERLLLGGPDFADHVTGDDEVGGVGLGQRRSGLATLVADFAQAKAVAKQVERQRPKCVVGVEQRKISQRREASAAAQVAVPGPAPTSSRLAGAKSGLISTSAFRLAVTAA